MEWLSIHFSLIHFLYGLHNRWRCSATADIGAPVIIKSTIAKPISECLWVESVFLLPTSLPKFPQFSPPVTIMSMCWVTAILCVHNRNVLCVESYTRMESLILCDIMWSVRIPFKTSLHNTSVYTHTIQESTITACWVNKILFHFMVFPSFTLEIWRKINKTQLNEPIKKYHHRQLFVSPCPHTFYMFLSMCIFQFATFIYTKKTIRTRTILNGYNLIYYSLPACDSSVAKNKAFSSKLATKIFALSKKFCSHFWW